MNSPHDLVLSKWLRYQFYHSQSEAYALLPPKPTLLVAFVLQIHLSFAIALCQRLLEPSKPIHVWIQSRFVPD